MEAGFAYGGNSSSRPLAHVQFDLWTVEPFPTPEPMAARDYGGLSVVSEFHGGPWIGLVPDRGPHAKKGRVLVLCFSVAHAHRGSGPFRSNTEIGKPLATLAN